MLSVTPNDVSEVRELGNGGQKFLPAADGRLWRLSYFKGKLRLDRYPIGATIPISARRGGGSALPAPSSE